MPELNVSWDSAGKALIAIVGTLIAYGFIHWAGVVDRAAENAVTIMTENRESTLASLADIQITQGRILERLDRTATKADIEKIKAKDALLDLRIDAHVSDHAPAVHVLPPPHLYDVPLP